MATVFETRTCSRCAGTGKFSFNIIDGDRCFKCRGSGMELTPRGAKAREMYLDSLNTKVSEIKVGWLVYTSFGAKSSKFHKVVDIVPDKLNPGRVALHFDNDEAFNIFEDSILQAVESADVRTAKVNAALAYQSTLPKAKSKKIA